MADASTLVPPADIGNCGERMVAGSGNWSYYAHLSLYHLAAPLIRGKDVLEAGCGTGYGSAYLARCEPRSFHACDASQQAVDFCRVHYKDEGITFEVADLGDSLPFPSQRFDIIFSSNVMEHIGPIDVFLAECQRVLRPGGKLFAVVPPNHSPGALEVNIRNVFHITNLTPLGWFAKLARHFSVVRSFRHWPCGVFAPEERVLADIPLPADHTTIRETDFALEEMPIDRLNTLPQNIGAVFIAEQPLNRALPESVLEFVPQEWCAGAIVSKVIQSEREAAQAVRSEADGLRAERELDRRRWERLATLAGGVDVATLQTLLDQDGEEAAAHVLRLLVHADAAGGSDAGAGRPGAAGPAAG
jgi:SAM-dependent methyltransferase